MGRSIIYCATCGTKILDKDFDSRAAFHLDARGFCKKCAPAALKSLPPDKMAEVLARISESESSSRRPAPQRPPASAPAPAPAPDTWRHGLQASRTPLIAGLALAGTVVVILLVVVTLSHSDPPPAPPPPPPTAVDRPTKVDREALAAQALQKAREYRDAHPQETATQISSLQRILEDHPGTRAAGGAQRDLEEIRRRAREDLESKLKSLQELARSTSSSEEFQNAIRKLADQRGLFSDPIWTQGIDQTTAEIKSAAETLYQEVRAAAVAARRQGSAAGVQEAKERLLKWGIPQYNADLEAALAAVPVSSKRPLINGRDTSGWQIIRGKWAFKDGLLQSIELDESQQTVIMCTEKFGDCELEGMIETPVKTYIELSARGGDRKVAMHLELGWHKFRVVAAGMDVKLFVDEKPVLLPAGTTREGTFSIFSLGAIRLKDVLIRP